MKASPEMKAMQQKVERFFKSKQTFQPSGSTWYRMEYTEESKEAEIYIYDAIGFFGVEAQEFVRDLSALECDKITLRINSPGGNVFDGTAIFNALKRHKATVHTHIDGVAASMASLIAMVGDTVTMADNAFFMIHNPWSFVIGTADDMRREAVLLDKIMETAVDIYEASSELSRSEVLRAMDAETWYTAEEAKQVGFADEIEGESEPQSSFDLSVFAKAPHSIECQNKQIELTERSLEAMLRDAGVSRSAAKQQVADFKASCQRDADEGLESGELDELAELLNQGASAFK